MKIGCTADISELAALKRLGYDYVELSGKTISKMSKEQIRYLENELIDNELPCTNINAYCSPEVVIAGPGFDEKKVHDYALNLMTRAARLGVHTISVGAPFSRRLPDGYSRERAIAQACRFFEITAETAKRFNSIICVEALGYCFCNFINSIQEADQIVRNVDIDNLGLVVDFYNMEQSQEADIDLSPFITKIFHVHISDDDKDCFRRDFMKEEKFPIHRKRVESLLKIGYRGDISVEIDLKVDERKAKKCLEMLRSCDHSIHNIS